MTIQTVKSRYVCIDYGLFMTCIGTDPWAVGVKLNWWGVRFMLIWWHVVIHWR